MYSLNTRGQEYLDEFWRTWSLPRNGLNSSMQEADDHVHLEAIGDKRRWWAYEARIKALPESYRSAVHAIERYFMFFGRGDGTGWAGQLEDLADLFEQAAADGTPIREIVGRTRRSSSRRSCRTTRRRSGSFASRNG